MDKIEIIVFETPTTGEKTDWVIIDRGNGEFTSMPKAVYDAQVEHLTEKPTGAEKL